MDMRPRHLYEEDLMDGLQRLVNEFRANTLLEGKLSGPSEGLEDLPDSHAIALFHICQEALANAAKHAQAKKVEILVWTTPDRVLMEVHDDGRGFDLQKVQLTLGLEFQYANPRHECGRDLEITTEPEVAPPSCWSVHSGIEPQESKTMTIPATCKKKAALRGEPLRSARRPARR